MNILEASRRSGLSPDTIRFYERHDVLPRPPRRENGYRDYAEEHLATLQLVAGLRHLEMPLKNMCEVARVAHDGTCRDLRGALTEQLQQSLEQTTGRIRELERTGAQIEQLLNGLEQMKPTEQRIPGNAPCGCVRLLGGRIRQ